MFGFELVAVVVGGEIGLLAMMRERVCGKETKFRERREMVLGYIILLCRYIILMYL